MTCALAKGACTCGNRLFIQGTAVLLPETCTTFTDTSSRKKKRAGDVMKVYECMACRARYIWNDKDSGFRGVG